MKRLIQILSLLFSAALGLVFLYSAYSKLDPIIETFEFSFVDIGVANWYTAPVLARLLIALELFTGLSLLFSYRLRRFTLPLTAFILLFFIVYLFIQIGISGNSGNCGCFGERLPMTPFQAIIKNIVLLLICIPLYKWDVSWSFKKNWLLPLLLLPVSIAAPFVINPVDFQYSSNNLEEKINYPLELDLLYNSSDTSQVEIPKVELRKDKHVLAFLSLTCGHCRIAAKKFRLFKKENPQLPIYFILNGDRKDLSAFLTDTKVDQIPYSFCLGKTFINLASARLPRIYYVDNSIVVKKVDYLEMNQYQIEAWLKGE